ncbi:10921_t:CDS:2, partial [Dentiscutata erythropus]
RSDVYKSMKQTTTLTFLCLCGIQENTGYKKNRFKLEKKDGVEVADKSEELQTTSIKNKG